MGSCYSGDHIAGDHIYTDITTRIIEVPQQKYRLGTASSAKLEGLNWFYMVRTI